MRPSDVLVLAGALLLYALVSARAERGVVSPPMAFTTLGLVVGAAGLGLVDPSVDGAFIHDLAEITLALTLFADAARIDPAALDRRHAIPLRLLGIGLPLTMLAGAVTAWALFPALGMWGAATLGVILAPTDAALGQAVVSNRSVPQRVRQALNVESGLNDGLAFPALLVVASLAAGTHARDVGGWLGFVGAQLALGPLAGALVGAIGGRLVERALERGWMGGLYLRLAALALPLVAYALAETVRGNGFLAAFACGVAVAATTPRLRRAAGEFGEAEGQLLALGVFVLLGAVLLPDLAGLGWRHALYAVLALTVLRMVPVALSLAGLGLRPATVLFVGWFGPRGLASVIYLLLVLEEYELPGIDDVRLAALVTVALSIVLHGASAAPFARRYGRAIGSGSGAEGEPVPGLALKIDAARAADGARGDGGR